LLLRPALLQPESPHIRANQPPHVHADGLAGCCEARLSPIVCIQTQSSW
jgi:hypothetical protein